MYLFHWKSYDNWRSASPAPVLSPAPAGRSCSSVYFHQDNKLLANSPCRFHIPVPATKARLVGGSDICAESILIWLYKIFCSKLEFIVLNFKLAHIIIRLYYLRVCEVSSSGFDMPETQLFAPNISQHNSSRFQTAQSLSTLQIFGNNWKRTSLSRGQSNRLRRFCAVLRLSFSPTASGDLWAWLPKKLNVGKAIRNGPSVVLFLGGTAVVEIWLEANGVNVIGFSFRSVLFLSLIGAIVVVTGGGVYFLGGFFVDDVFGGLERAQREGEKKLKGLLSGLLATTGARTVTEIKKVIFYMSRTKDKINKWERLD